jgi:hypothetical protein
MTEIGSFFWYSVPDESVSATRVRRAWRAAELDVGYLPRGRRNADVAVEAVKLSSAELQLVETTDEALVFRGASGVLRFVRSSEQWVAGELGSITSAVTADHYREITGLYERNLNRITAHKHRYALRTLLADRGAEHIHGPVYFMPTWGSDHLGRLDAMLFALYASAEMHSIPIPSTSLQLNYVREHLRRNFQGRMVSLTDDVVAASTMRGRRIRQDRVDTIMRDCHELVERLKRLAGVVGDIDVDEDFERLQIALRQFIENRSVAA